MDDKQKEKVESLQEVVQQKDKDFLEQQKQLLKLSALVDGQKLKLIEQDSKLMKKQNDTLVYQADGLKERKVVSFVENNNEEREDNMLLMNVSIYEEL